jgi:hypothetical protein
MSEAALKCATQEIVVDDVLPHEPETIWKTLTTGELIGRWLMQPTGFAPVKGTRFTFQTTPAGAWDGVVIASCLRSRAASVCPIRGKVDVTAMRIMARASTRSSPGLSPGATSARGFVSSIPVS